MKNYLCNSFQVAGKGGAASTIEAGIRATAQLLGEDVGKEVRLMQLEIKFRSFLKFAIIFGWIASIFCNKTHISIL